MGNVFRGLARETGAPGCALIANVMAVAGLAAVGLAVSAAGLLLTGYLTSAVPAALITAFVTCMFGMLWFAFPRAPLTSTR